MILLDTDFISQLAKPQPDIRVFTWLNAQPEKQMHISAITVMELRMGIDRLPSGRKRRELDTWLKADVLVRFAQRTLAVDMAVGNRAGVLIAQQHSSGFTPDMADTLIAATALVHGMHLATLNRKDFRRLGVELVDLNG